MNKLKVKTKSHDLLIEVGTEELPSGSVNVLPQALADFFVTRFIDQGISFGQMRVFATPRRLGFLLHDVAEQQPTQTITRRGPAVSPQDKTLEPSKALMGFAKSCGVETNALKRMKTDKGEWWFYETTQPGSMTIDLLLSMLQDALQTLPIPKPMRWSEGIYAFTRPVHWVIALYGDRIVDGSVMGVQINNLSRGHRFHHPEPITIPVPCLYESLLMDAKVVVDFAKRRQMILQQIEKIAAEKHVTPIIPDDLLDEVTAIVEWPNALMASFDESFLSVPAEALIASMQSHQKCFALNNEAGQLSAHFITVCNIESKMPEQVLQGNEKVMRARLSDAAFFYQQDLKKPLTEYLPDMEKVVFQARLGSLADKTTRMRALMASLQQVFELDADEAQRAVLLSKCDLLSGMVGEFPELQGLMGSYYATHHGESPAIAAALYEQYLPKFSTDILPSTSLGTALSLVDRLDTLVGFWGIGQKPTGVKDPFKLRRHALAIVRLLIKTRSSLTLSGLIEMTGHVYSGQFSVDPASLVADLKVFILERLQSYYQSQGIAPEMIYAVRARQDEWLFDLDKRLSALIEFVQLKESYALSQACKRVSNIVSQWPDMDLDLLKEVQKKLLTDGAEQALYEAIERIEKDIEPAYAAGEYNTILQTLATLKTPIDTFFENVMVMVEDESLKQNRIGLLLRLQALLQGVADISQLTHLVSPSPTKKQQSRVWQA